VYDHIKLLWAFEEDILKVFFGTYYIDELTLASKKKGYDLLRIKPSHFFIEVLPVTANRFRPENKMGGIAFFSN